MPSQIKSATPLPHATDGPCRNGLALLAALVVGLLLSFLVCIVVMRTAVGVVAMPGSIVGISEANFTLTMTAATLLGGATALATACVFAKASRRWSWLAIAPALLLPIGGGAGFGIFLLMGMA